jgi:hypothetical protein
MSTVPEIQNIEEMIQNGEIDEDEAKVLKKLILRKSVAVNSKDIFKLTFSIFFSKKKKLSIKIPSHQMIGEFIYQIWFNKIFFIIKSIFLTKFQSKLFKNLLFQNYGPIISMLVMKFWCLLLLLQLISGIYISKDGTLFTLNF